jgi:AcrR family transcriptional regulator
MGIPERKEREKEHRREEIVDAAQKIFFAKGLLNSTMDEIAEAAELSKGTIYLYYKSKEDLYLAVMMRGMERLHEMFVEAVGGAENSVHALHRIGETYYRFFLDQRHYFRMFHFLQYPQFHKQVSEEMLATCSTQNQKIWDLVVSLIEDGMKKGLLRRDLSPPEAAMLLWSSSNALMLRIDNEQDHWSTRIGLDLDRLLLKSQSLQLEALMTDEGKRLTLGTQAAQ